MRHVKTLSCSNYIKPECRPCDEGYKFNSPTPNRVYVKVLKFVEANPGCKRRDIINAIYGKGYSRGHCSLMFSHMLYADILDYNAKYEYRVTRKGKSILRKVSDDNTSTNT